MSVVLPKAKKGEGAIPLPGRAANQLPEPKGWRMLLGIPEVAEETSGGILKADMTKDLETTSTVVGLVLAMGDQCYNDKERFGDEPWCKEGDFVLIGAYKGVRFKVHGREFRLINDDTVQAVVDDPRGYTRA
jgi:co-chaperonin GroES (HSP10)